MVLANLQSTEILRSLFVVCLIIKIYTKPLQKSLFITEFTNNDGWLINKAIVFWLIYVKHRIGNISAI